MKKKVSVKAVAAAAGISEATASRVLSGQSTRFRIPPVTEKTVVEAAARLGYSINKRFYKPEALRSRMIGMVIPDLSHYFLGRLARTVVERARDAGFSVIASDSLEDSQQESKLIDMLVLREIDGLLLLPVGNEWQHIRELTRRGLPVVLMDRLVPDIDCHCVGVDNYRAAFRATDYLIGCGHRRIACIQRLPHAWISDERVRGYRDAHQAHGLEVDVSLVMGEQFGRHNGYLEVKRLLDMKPRPTAIFALSHLVTLEALHALRDHGLSVPEDMSLVGFDDLPYADMFAQPVTVMRQPIQEMARMAVDLLLAQIERSVSAKPISVELPCELVQRNSVKLISTQAKIPIEA
jgi:LacI family transcriptional regulator